VLALFLVFSVALYVLRLFTGTIGVLVWGALLVSSVLIVSVAIGREAWRDFPPELNAVTKRTRAYPASVEAICACVPRVVAKKHWRLEETDAASGVFKAKIGMSLWTWAQIMQIAVTKSDEGTSRVRVRCEALHQKYDWGRNNRMTADFYRELKNQLGHKDTKTTAS
jgi:hypothetical protein